MELKETFDYITMQGDTFDMLALDVWNDEFLSVELIRANPRYAQVVVFDAGVLLLIPRRPPDSTSTLPPWKRA